MIKSKKDKNCIKFGYRLRYMRLAAGMSQEELAYKAELDRTYIGGVERGERNPSLKNIIRLAYALKITPDQFFTEEK